MLLGFRHGIDWDHIAAITDIVGTASSSDLTVSGETARLSFTKMQERAILLSAAYAGGHSLIVVAIGLAAMLFAASLPKWIDPIMERIVGGTLVALGLWVAYSLWQHARGHSDFRMQSRWMLVFSAAGNAMTWLRQKLTGHHCHHKLLPEDYSPRTALAVGMIHGIGAETGTQVLLLTAVAGTTDYWLGSLMLLAFTLGFIGSNTLVALISATGFVTSARIKPLYITTGVLTALFSLIVGVCFIFGEATWLPDLERILSK
jgi:high-affinity nickel-transport protein